jgi:hypothetical protein
MTLGGPLVFSNLTAGAAYELIIYSEDVVSGISTATFTIGADARTAAATGGSTFVQNKNYVDFASVLADGTGTLTVNASSNAIVNGFQLRALPASPAVPLPAGIWGALALAAGVIGANVRRGTLKSRTLSR